MTPAERLRAAADRIEERARDAIGAMGAGPWYMELAAEGYGTRSGEGYLTASGMAEEVAEQVALWDPPTALLTGGILRAMAGILAEADTLGVTIHPGDLTTAALALADAILAGGN